MRPTLLCLPLILLGALTACGGSADPDAPPSEDPRSRDDGDPEIDPAAISDVIGLPESAAIPKVEGAVHRAPAKEVLLERVLRTAGGWLLAIRILEDGRIHRGEGPLNAVRWADIGAITPQQRQELDELRGIDDLDKLPTRTGATPSQVTEQTPRNVWTVRRPDNTLRTFELYGYPGPRFPLLDRMAKLALPDPDELGFTPRSALVSPDTGGWVLMPCRAGQIRDLQPLAQTLQDPHHPPTDSAPDQPLLTLHELDPAGGQSWTLDRAGRVTHINLRGQSVTRRLSDTGLSIARTLIEELNFEGLPEGCPSPP